VHRRRNDRIELRQPVRQFLIEETAQFDCAEPAFEKHAVGRFRLGQGEFKRTLIAFGKRRAQ